MFLIQGYHWSDGGGGVVCQVQGNKGAERSLLVNIYYFSKKYLSQLDFDRSVPWGWVLPIIFFKEEKKEREKKEIESKKTYLCKMRAKRPGRLSHPVQGSENHG